jgi:hypothetical protein
VVPGDCVVSAPRFPADVDDVARLREAVRRIVQPGMGPAERVTLVNNVVGLGQQMLTYFRKSIGLARFLPGGKWTFCAIRNWERER